MIFNMTLERSLTPKFSPTEGTFENSLSVSVIIQVQLQIVQVEKDLATLITNQFIRLRVARLMSLKVTESLKFSRAVVSTASQRRRRH